MGLSLARAGDDRGWDTTLLLGPITAPTCNDTGLRIQRFRTARDLQTLLHEHVPECDVLIMAAAVADYRPLESHPETKLRRSSDNLRLDLEPVPDLLAELGKQKRPGQYFVGFALEPRESLPERAASKLKEKRLDAIVGNPLETMDSEQIEGKILVCRGDGIDDISLEKCEKDRFAAQLLDLIAQEIEASNAKTCPES